MDDRMNAGFRDLAAGDFESGLASLDADSKWHDNRLDLERPSRLGFPGAQGWGEELLVASLLERHADASKAAVEVFACEHVCSILKHDPAFLVSSGATPPSNIERRPRVGIVWASVSKGHAISEKSVPVEQFLPALTGIDADLVSLQRKLFVADPNGLARKRGVQLIEDDILDAGTESSVEALLEAIRELDSLVTISTTTTHIAAAMGTI